MLRGVKAVDIIGLGVVFLIANLTARHVSATPDHLLIFVTGWIGSILIIVGLGWLLFLN